MDHASILERLGGAAAVAVALSVPPVRVQRWRMRCRIPSEYWPRIVDLATAQGRADIGLSSLAAAQPARGSVAQGAA
jgi:hypothetical protein